MFFSPRRTAFGIFLVAAVLISSLPAQGILGNGLLGRMARLKGGKAFRSSSTDPGGRNKDYRIFRPGEELILLDTKGSGVIRHIWMTIDPGRAMKASARRITLRMYWENRACPAVEVPLGDFFGMGFGVRHNLWTLPVRVSAEGRAMNCFLPMPFREAAKITLTNNGNKPVLAYWNVDGLMGAVPKDVGYFHASYHQEVPYVNGPEYELLAVEGCGVYVGSLVCLQQTWPGWPGEGDDRFYVDGDPNPTLEGTGLEDYFLDAWDFRRSESPYYAIPLSMGSRIGSLHSALRWHVEAPIPFKRHIRVAVEKYGRAYDKRGKCTGNGPRKDNYSSVAFFYLNRPVNPKRVPLIAADKRLFPEVVPEARFSRGLVVEAEGLAAVKGPGKKTVVSGNRLVWGRGGLLRWTPKKSGDTLVLPLGKPQPGAHRVEMTLRRGRTGGRFCLSLNGGEEVVLDAFKDQRQEICFPETCLVGNLTTLGKDMIFLKIRCTGRNAFAKGVSLEIDRLVVAKVK